ncbi:MAG: hypothetical protein HC800_18150 [Phormidesmis sp. RL_2_1]|nr:hypothetical protein [Phormidesmis sp. RL_2_1]
MACQNPHTTSLAHAPQSPFPLGRRVGKLVTRLGSGLLAAGLSLSMALPSFAADPFRSSSAAHDIGDKTEAAFKAIFKEGNYVAAERYLAEAELEESDEPLVHAMLASMAYLKGDDGLPEVLRRAMLTQEKAQALLEKDPLRGHLYTAVGIFLEGAHVLKTQGIANGTPRALGMLQQVFRELDDAEAINPDDPELNLLKGYMDLMLAVNLPFSNPEEAITRMSEYGSPEYLAQRGIAIGYRDLERPDAAMIAVDKALSAAPNNPELFYLKAQILNRQGDRAESIDFFDRALDYSAQLPDALVTRITWERCVTVGGPDVNNCSVAAGYI